MTNGVAAKNAYADPTITPITMSGAVFRVSIRQNGVTADRHHFP
jgi:hypothetical protein